ncbi:MAG: acyl-CoA thioesterase [Acidimicrobiia bacterium]
MAAPDDAVAALRAVVGVEPVGEGAARGTTGNGGVARGGLFGGQVIAQCLSACAHTVPAGAVPDSLHVNLLRTGRSGDPIDFTVERVRDGRSLQHRDVRGYQDGQLIVQAAVVSSVQTAGLDWQRDEVPDVPGPDVRPDAPPSLHRHLGWGVFEVAHPLTEQDGEPPSHPLWVRSPIELPDDPWLDGAVKAFWTDFGMNWNARATHNGLDPAQVASLSATHSVWFHRRRPTHEWHLLDVHTRSLLGNQGFVQASLFDGAGGLAVSIAQGVFVRWPSP